MPSKDPEWLKDIATENYKFKIFIKGQSANGKVAKPRLGPQIKASSITDNFDVNINKCPRLIRENPTYHEVLESMYSLDNEDKKFCISNGINTFLLKRFFTSASRALHDQFFIPSPMSMIGIDAKTCDKLKEYYDNVLKARKEKSGSSPSLALAPSPNRVLHMSDDANIPESQPKFICFCPPKENISAPRRRLKVFNGSYENALNFSYEANIMYSQAVNIVAENAKDLNTVQKLNEEHKMIFGNYDGMDDNAEAAESSGVMDDEDLEGSPKSIQKLADLLEDLELGEDSDIELDSDDEFMDIPKASDSFVDMVKKQAAVTKCLSFLGYSAMQSTDTSNISKENYQRQSTPANRLRHTSIARRNFSPPR